MSNEITLRETLEVCGMIQLSIKSKSLRVRKHRFYTGKYFATTRVFKQHGEIMFDLENVEEALNLISSFCKGEL